MPCRCGRVPSRVCRLHEIMEGGWKTYRARSRILTANSKELQEPLRSTVNVGQGEGAGRNVVGIYAA